MIKITASMNIIYTQKARAAQMCSKLWIPANSWSSWVRRRVYLCWPLHIFQQILTQSAPAITEHNMQNCNDRKALDDLQVLWTMVLIVSLHCQHGTFDQRADVCIPLLQGASCPPPEKVFDGQFPCTHILFFQVQHCTHRMEFAI